jgi:hypothetical protein
MEGTGCMLLECEERTTFEVTEEGIEPCEPGRCFKYVIDDGIKCTELCTNYDHYYGNLETHIYEEKVCFDRTSNGSTKNPC